jgi:hypothetical protein
MSLSLDERACFLRRTALAFHNEQSLARQARKALLYSLDDLRGLVARYLGERGCPYCRGSVTTASFVLGHKLAIARGGKFSFRNLDVCCKRCGILKGDLAASEFRELMQLTSTWPRQVREHFLAQLRLGAQLSPPPVPHFDHRNGSPS